MSLAGLARAYLRQAEVRIKDARRAHRAGNYPYSLRLTQECVELSVKAALRAVGLEYPKQHEVSDLLAEFSSRFPAWFVSEIPLMQRTSKSLFKKRELAFYGGEEAILGPEEVVGKEDSAGAIVDGGRAFEACRRFVDTLAAR